MELPKDRRHEAHWLLEDFRQRVTTKVWRQMLLNFHDNLTVKGRHRRLVGVNLGAGVWEVSKAPYKGGYVSD
jgi:hypothetical protein